MALPPVAPFEDFLAGTRVVTEPPTGPCEQFHHSSGSVQGRGTTLWLAYPPTKVQLDSVLKKLAETLSTAGSPATRSVALAVLGLIVETKGPEHHVEHANRLLSELRKARVSLNFVSPSPLPNADIRADYGPITIEPFDPRKLEYWAQRGGSRWPIAPQELRGRVALVSEPQDVALINTDQLPGAERLLRHWGQATITLVDAYFQSVADASVEKLKREISQRLGLVEAAGIAGFDFSSVASWSLGVHLITWSGSGRSKAGCWAIFRAPGIEINTPPAESWRHAREWLLREFGLDNLSLRDRPIDVAAQTFARLLQDARAHLADGRVREAFLYFVIALDYMLGEDGRNVATVADRTSVLTHRMRSKAFADEVACVRKVYDTRSRFVHSGSPVTAADLSEADAIARSVLWAITRVVASDKLATRDEWIKSIDALAHLFWGDPTLITEDRLIAVGAESDFRAGSPPPMLRDRGARSTDWE